MSVHVEDSIPYPQVSITPTTMQIVRGITYPAGLLSVCVTYQKADTRGVGLYSYDNEEDTPTKGIYTLITRSQKPV